MSMKGKKYITNKLPKMHGRKVVNRSAGPSRVFTSWGEYTVDEDLVIYESVRRPKLIKRFCGR